MRYEVGVAIATGWIVWANGPFPCGSWLDLKIARHGIQHYLNGHKKYIADGGYSYRGQFGVMLTGQNNIEQQMQAVVRARHETINARLKCWGALANTFRHDLRLHRMVFMSIANVVQVVMEEESPAFQVDYYG